MVNLGPSTRGVGMIHTSTEGQSGLPRYFAQVFAMAQGIARGRADFVLPDGRVFRVEGPEPGPVAERLLVHLEAGKGSKTPLT